METGQGSFESLKLDLAVKEAQLQELRVKAKVAAAEAEARFADEIGAKEGEVRAVKARLREAGYTARVAGAELWTVLKEGTCRTAKAAGKMARSLLDRM